MKTTRSRDLLWIAAPPPAASALLLRGARRAATLLLSLAPALAGAQPSPAAGASPVAGPRADAAEAVAEAAAEDSPRASVTAYLEACRAGRFQDAARYLKLEDGRLADGPRLAEQLKVVLDRHLWLDLDALSPLPGGNPDDGLPPGTDELGSVPGASGRPEPVRLVRLEGADPAHWAFSRGTVDRIDSWYAGLGDRWLRENLPAPLLRVGPRELLHWQWIALVLLALVSWAGGRLLGGATRSVLGRAFARTATEWDDLLLRKLGGPLTLGWGLALAYLLLPSLGLAVPAHRLVVGALGAIAVVALFWALWRAVDVAGHALSSSSWAQGNPSAKSLLSIGVRSGKVAVLAVGSVAALSQLGYPVASLLAGLGLGGLAFALAAQKTVENFFGSVSLAVDQPFRVGDFVKVEDFVGTIEAIGLRSTRIRTLDRTVVSIPNGRLADMRLESFTMRDRLRLACTIGVEYGTSAAQMRQVLEGLENVLRSHPLIWPDAVVVRFKEFAASSLDIEIMAWFQTAVWSEFQLIRQEVLIGFMEVVEGAGASFAFPTRTVHVVNAPAADPPS